MEHFYIPLNKELSWFTNISQRNISSYVLYYQENENMKANLFRVSLRHLYFYKQTLVNDKRKITKVCVLHEELVVLSWYNSIFVNMDLEKEKENIEWHRICALATFQLEYNQWPRLVIESFNPTILISLRIIFSQSKGNGAINSLGSFYR